MSKITIEKNLFCLPWTQTILGTHIGGKPNVKKIRHFLLTMPDKLDCEKISIGDHAVGDKSEKAGLCACCGDATCNPGCFN